MITLDLVNLSKSNIKYKISKFPDGQQTIDIINWYYIPNPENPTQESLIEIRTRLNSFQDLEILICAVNALRNIAPCNIELYVPYFLGSRSDRKFVDGGVNYLKQVICPIINSLNFSKVSVLDPHSDVLEACLNNYVKFNNHFLVTMALRDIGGNLEDVCLVSPDAGAYKKIFDVAKMFGIKKVITATKVRDLETGKILHTEVPTLDQHNNIKYLIVDDICDGGRTFIEIAKAMKESRPTAKIYLVVSHGIFSGGFYDLDELFEGIFCTNSYEDIESKVIEGKGSTTNSRGSSITKPNFVKQFNVF
jgi:ribose-phosphate pyrophosphokinase